MQNLKAVTMGMVTPRALFWSNKPNPAMTDRSWVLVFLSRFLHRE